LTLVSPFVSFLRGVGIFTVADIRLPVSSFDRYWVRKPVIKPGNKFLQIC